MARKFGFDISPLDVQSTLQAKFPSNSGVDDWDYIMQKVFTNVNSIAAVDSIDVAGQTGASTKFRTPGVYTGLSATTTGDGSGAVFKVTVSNDTDTGYGTTTSVEVTSKGKNYTDNDILVISNSSLGGGYDIDSLVVDGTGSNTAYAATYTSFLGITANSTGKSYDSVNDQIITNTFQDYFVGAAGATTTDMILWDSANSYWVIIPQVTQSNNSYSSTPVAVSDWGSNSRNPSGTSTTYGAITLTTTNVKNLQFRVDGITNTAQEIVFDKNISRNPTHRTLVAKFGDGYEQRVLDGINSKNETISASFVNRDWTEIETIAAFFDAKAARNFTITLQREAIKVLCENYSITHSRNDIHTLTVELRRVYEP